MRLDAAGRLLDIDAPDELDCRACGGRATRQTSAFQGRGVVYHHYRCRATCPAGGAIVEHEGDNSGERHRVGPVFGDRDLAVRLTTREHLDLPAEAAEVAP